jgi:hypothetical protein
VNDELRSALIGTAGLGVAVAINFFLAVVRPVHSWRETRKDVELEKVWASRTRRPKGVLYVGRSKNETTKQKIPSTAPGCRRGTGPALA